MLRNVCLCTFVCSLHLQSTYAEHQYRAEHHPHGDYYFFTSPAMSILIVDSTDILTLFTALDGH